MKTLFILLLVTYCFSITAQMSLIGTWTTGWQNNQDSCCSPSSVIISNSTIYAGDYNVRFIYNSIYAQQNYYCQLQDICGDFEDVLAPTNDAEWLTGGYSLTESQMVDGIFLTYAPYGIHPCHIYLIPNDINTPNQDKYVAEFNNSHFSSQKNDISSCCVPNTLSIVFEPNSTQLFTTYTFGHDALENQWCQSKQVGPGIYNEIATISGYGVESTIWRDSYFSWILNPNSPIIEGYFMNHQNSCSFNITYNFINYYE